MNTIANDTSTRLNQRALIEQITSYHLQLIELPETKILTKKNLIILDLLEEYYLSQEERSALLKGKGFFDRLHFYCIGHTQIVDKRIQARMNIDQAITNVLFKQIMALNPPKKTIDQIRNIQKEQTDYLNSLRKEQYYLQIAQISLIATTVFTGLYFGYSIWEDSKAHCSFTPNSNTPDVIYQFHKDHCFSQDPFNYLKRFVVKVSALPIMVMGATLLSEFEIFSRFALTPIKTARKKAATITHNVSQIKDFLIKKSLEITN